MKKLMLLFLLLPALVMAQPRKITIGTPGGGTTTDAGLLTSGTLAADRLPTSVLRTVSQTHTSGSTLVVTPATTWLVVDPGSILSTLAISLPSSPVNGQQLVISFGGSISAGTVVTSLMINPASGQSLRQAEVLSSIESGESLTYRFKTSSATWYQTN